MDLQSIALFITVTRTYGPEHNYALQQAYSFSNREICPNTGPILYNFL